MNVLLAVMQQTVLLCGERSTNWRHS